MSFFKTVRNSFGLIRQNKRIYMESVVILQLMRSLIVLPLISYVFYRMLSIAGVRSLTENTIISLVRQPLALILLVVIALLSIFFIFYEQAYYLLLVDSHKQQNSLPLGKIIRQINGKAKYFLSFHSIFFLVYFLLILPIASIGMSASVLQELRVPHFITDELMKSTNGKIIYGIVFLSIVFLSVRFIFTVPYFILESKTTIGQAAKKSWRATRHQLMKIVVWLSAIFLVYGLSMTGIVYISFLPLRLFEAWVSIATPFAAGLTLAWLQIIFFFSFGFLQVLVAAMILSLAAPGTSLLKRDQQKSQGSLLVISKHPVLNSLLLIGAFSGLSLINTYSLTETVYRPTTQIIAHRGYTSKGVENTLGALEAAAKVQADYVEMDVQETKDQQFVVYHDTTLSRLTDRNDRVADLTLAELEAIEVSSGGFTDNIPSLQTFIERAEELDIPLLVEIKLHGDESPEMAANLVGILQEYQVTTKFLVQSLDEQILEEVKEIDPTIQTGYLIALNIGKLPETSADFIALEEFSLNQKLLEQAEEENKPIFVWTVNQEQLVRQSLRMNVNGIITNYPSQAIDLRNSFDEEKTFVERVKEFLD